ncbi:MAG: peptidoglycan DD-metalloendopeptidase family protein [Lachnospiraceae bacterium]|nr:peptidoglycan DD-metalloendopeptidase family protein [Lachnospiraceae bacterium]
MKRRKSGGAYRKEKLILTASSVLVLTAMTVTGLYVYNSNQTEVPEDNVVDFSVLENGTRENEPQVAQAENPSAQNLTSGQESSGELDYDPYYAQQDSELNDQPASAGAQKAQEETNTAQEGAAESETVAQQSGMSRNVGYAEIDGSGNVQADMGMIGENDLEAGAGSDGASDQVADGSPEADEEQALAEADGSQEFAEADGVSDGQALAAVADVVQEEINLHFAEENELQWPIVGNVLLNYSMDKTIYFPTLEQYKYNPSIVIASTQGTDVKCAAKGVVKSIYNDPQTGNTVVMNLGDGYELTYGQLTDITVEVGELVENGVLIGKVAAPTKYYTTEGTNVYFKLTKDGEPVNPLDYLG